MTDLELREHILRRWTRLKIEREPYIPQWLAISQQITPASGRFFETDEKNRGRERWNRIYNNCAVRAANILQAGLMSGLSDPSTQWFSPTSGSPDLDERQEVKVWLDQVQRILEMAFTRTNVYQALQHIWREVGAFGVTACAVIEDDEYGFVCYPLCCGEYCIACDYRGIPDTLYRRFTMTAIQLVERFGRSKVSKSVLEKYDAGAYDEEFRVIHAIEPREFRDRSKVDAENMAWRGVLLQVEADEMSAGILEETGYHEFPAIVGRWGASASDVYSEESPGMVAIGDTRELQHSVLQKGNAIDLQVNPPLILPVSARESEMDFLPGGRSYIDSPGQKDQVQTAWAVNLNLNDLRQDMAEVQQRIERAFYVDLFLMFQGRTQNMTATEVAQRSSEKLMMLGPVLSRLTNEILKPLIERAFNILYRKGHFPPAPQELAGQVLNIEYTSMLARSQRAIRANAIDEFMQRVMTVAQVNPQVVSKLNVLELVDEYADCYSVAPSIVVPSDEAQAQIEAQQQAQAQQAQAQQGLQAVDALSKLGRVPAGQETMAGQAVQGISDAAQQSSQE